VTVTLTAADKDTTKNIKTGQTAVVELDTAGGSGYTWKTVSNGDATVLQEAGHKQEKKAGTETTAIGGAPLTGTPEVVSTTFKATAAGTTKVVLGHVPPAGGSPEETFTFTVVVTD
jgi:predicted secreted protein